MKASLRAAALSTVVFIALTVFFHFNYLADDYGYVLLKQIHGIVTLSDLQQFLVRRPICALFDSLFFSLSGTSFPKALLWFVFFFYSWGFSALLFHLIEILKRDRHLIVNEKHAIFSCVLLTLYPAHYEMLYTVVAWGWLMGLPLLAIGLLSRRPGVQILFLTLAFLSFETYVPLAFSYLFFEFCITKKRPGIAVLISLALALSTQKLLAASYERNLELTHLGEHIIDSLSWTWRIHFYKVNWVSTSLEWVAMALLAWRLIAQRTIQYRTGIALLLLVCVTSVPGWVIGYYAPRAVFGAVILRNLIFALAFCLALRAGRPFWGRSAFVLVALAYLIHDGVIFFEKNRNYDVLAQKESRIAQQMHDCAPPCVIDLGQSLGAGLKSDWIMPALAWETYTSWLRARYEPGKQIEFEFSDRGLTR